MNDHDFIQSVETLTLDAFPHYDHIRMAWIYLREYGYDEGIIKIREALKKLATHHGIPNHYHETITLFWAKMVQHALQQTPTIDDYQTFVTDHHPQLLDKDLIKTYYDMAIIKSGRSRKAWIDPDLQALPV